MKNKNEVKYIAIATGDKGFSVPAEQIIGASFMKESEKDKKLVNAQYELVLKELEKLNASVKNSSQNKQQQQTGGSGGASVPSNYSKYKRQ
jgi:hypothetical protein